MPPPRSAKIKAVLLQSRYYHQRHFPTAAMFKLMSHQACEPYAPASTAATTPMRRMTHTLCLCSTYVHTHAGSPSATYGIAGGCCKLPCQPTDCQPNAISALLLPHDRQARHTRMCPVSWIPLAAAPCRELLLLVMLLLPPLQGLAAPAQQVQGWPAAQPPSTSPGRSPAHSIRHATCLANAHTQAGDAAQLGEHSRHAAARLLAPAEHELTPPKRDCAPCSGYMKSFAWLSVQSSQCHAAALLLFCPMHAPPNSTHLHVLTEGRAIHLQEQTRHVQAMSRMTSTPS